MRGSFKMVNPEEMGATLTVTMPLKDWRSLHEQLEKKWPAWEFGALIRKMLEEANRTFNADEKDIKS